MERTATTNVSGDSFTKRRAEEENKEQSEKTIKAEDEERGVKRSIAEWEALAKKTKTTAEQRAEESKNPGKGVDINHFHVSREVGAVSVGESDVKFDGAVFDCIDGSWREYEEELYYEAISGKVIGQGVGGGSEEGRGGETFKKHGV